MATRCDECRRTIKGEGRRTMVRVLCDDCYARSTGAAAGLIAGGTVGDAVATSGWFRSLIGRRKTD